MKTMKERWSRSLATLALFATVAAEPHVSGAPNTQARAAGPPSGTTALNASTLVQDGRLLLEMGSLDAAEQKLQQALRAAPSDPKAKYLLDRVQEARMVNAAKQDDLTAPALTPPADSSNLQFAAANNTPPEKPAPRAEAPANTWPPAAEPEPEEPASESESNIYRMDPRLLERYGIRPRSSPAPARSGRTSRGKQQIENKLNHIVLNEISLDNIPLSELVKFLSDEARRRDPEKKGINFIIANVPEGAAAGVDPTTGMPMAITAVDIGAAMVKLRLTDVRLKDVLDAVTRVAEQPVRYSVEDYGVVFSPGPGQPATFGIASGARSVEPPPLMVRTFRVDTNTFLPGLEGAFGIKLGDFKDRPAGAPVREAVREVLHQLGINMDTPQKTIIYNYLTGIVMVRATPEEMELIQSAMETLGGEVLRQGPRVQVGGRYGTGFGGGFGPTGGGGYGGTAGGGMGRTEPEGEKKMF